VRRSSSCNDEGGDARPSGRCASPCRRVSHRTWVPYDDLYPLQRQGGTADLYAFACDGGDLTINAYAITNLAPSALDKMARPGHGNESLIGSTGSRAMQRVRVGTIGYSVTTGQPAHGSTGFTSGGQFKSSGGIRGLRMATSGSSERCVHGGKRPAS